MELALGLWLLVSPFVFGHDPSRLRLWLNDLTCGSLLIVLPLLAQWRPLRHAHLLLLPLAAWLVASGWWLTLGSSLHPDPAYQNWILVGLMVAMFAVVPSEASTPPGPWRAD